MKVLCICIELEAAEKVNLAARLRWPRATVQIVEEAQSGLEVVRDQRPDVVIFQLDPGGTPVEMFIRGLRAFSDVPLIVLEPPSRAGDLAEVNALEAGADDYIRRSAGIIDIVARMVAVVRRARRADIFGGGGVLSSGSLILDPATYEVFLDGTRVDLTSTEFRLLHLFLENRGNVVTHQTLARSLWGDRVDSSELVKKYIQRLRRKLGDSAHNSEWIVNVHGVGYKFSVRQIPAREEVAALR